MIILLIVPWLSYKLSHDYPINYPMIILLIVPWLSY